MKKDAVEICLLKIARTLVKGYGTIDNEWYLVTQEFIDTIFQLNKNPEAIAQYLIIKLSKPLFNNRITQEETMHFQTQHMDSVNKFSQFANTQAMNVDDDNQNINCNYFIT
jgi:hypothetical protein